jgi:hypothetical protein
MKDLPKKREELDRAIDALAKIWASKNSGVSPLEVFEALIEDFVTYLEDESGNVKKATEEGEQFLRTLENLSRVNKLQSP